ncbi:7,8-didemethyl-8-hydroxy-5-deazariboflavin synthase subunit CofG [Pantanalinema sp. GBBB05]|uniref:7,8-didemethyl-8-hydroxy-5-deazariboflavin synthase subunit CofG n=1 Tax=Pantanalinema sp. GBBB05 TaxID=2604139 RepID=UPI001DC31E87|nr:7,8-didemethyl-8-hydroxy-5-deazariboflavin synthase subunit CofG [Pantanalinema sp. GBBB05]
MTARTVTYSPAHTLVPTYECFNRCTYCNFRVDPGTHTGLSLSIAAEQLQRLRDHGVIEILILSGEVHPQSPDRPTWFQRIYELCELSLSLGFLPHTNAGILSRVEMECLKTVNVSMGLMLEQITPALLQTVHRHAPSKVPAVRLQQLIWAGELRIPFTTGLLLGIGETADDRLATLEAIAAIAEQWGHIQEVILQPYSPGQQEALSGEACEIGDLIDLIAIARSILPSEVALQVPPNLIQEPEQLIACIAAGARDLGGIGVRDEVNPDYTHPIDRTLAQTLAQAGWQLIPRLPVYPQYFDWLSEPLRQAVDRWQQQLDQTGIPKI